MLQALAGLSTFGYLGFPLGVDEDKVAQISCSGRQIHRKPPCVAQGAWALFAASEKHPRS